MTVKIPVTRTTQPKSRPHVSDLSFGRFFTDHMFVLNFDRKKGWHSPRVVPYAPFSLDPAAAVFHYGQELFEGLKAFRGVNDEIRFFRPDYNCDRLNVGAERLCMPAVDPKLSLAGIKALVDVDRDWIPTGKGTSLYLRPTLIATEGFLGVRPSDEYLFYVIASPVGSYYAEGSRPVKIWVEDEQVRAAPGGLGAVKAGANYAASLHAAFVAKQKGYAQVLWLDAVERKYIEEVGTMNVFFVFGRDVVTPPLNGTILAGNVRECAIALMRESGLKVTERALTIDEVLAGAKAGTLTEFFGTGTAAVVSPVGELAYRGTTYRISEDWGPVATELYRTITALQYGEVKDAHGWIQT